jgi:hypothetical protein
MEIKAASYGGFSGCHLADETFDLGEGLILTNTFAHLMSPYMMAFSPPGIDGFHPAPWRAAKGGWGFDIHVQLRVPANFSKSHWSDHTEVIWWIAALMRLAWVPFITVPIISDTPFTDVPTLKNEPHLNPFEITTRIFGPADDEKRVLQNVQLAWIRDHWIQAGELMNANPKFATAFRAFDAAMVRGKSSASMLALWGGLEQLFSPSTSELRFRVSAMIAAFLAPAGDERLALFKKVANLYNVRSTAAHTASDTEVGPLLESYVLMRNALVKMIDENRVPTREDLDALLFGCS